MLVAQCGPVTVTVTGTMNPFWTKYCLRRIALTHGRGNGTWVSR